MADTNSKSLNSIFSDKILPDWWANNKALVSIAILTIVYAIGIIGIETQLHSSFIYLTPINLLFSLFIVLLHHKGWQLSHYLFLGICFTIGFLSEVIGVNTGIIFGEYSYGNVLGLKVWGTPLIIGINWLLLVYASSTLMNHLFPGVNKIGRAFLAAFLMVLLDVLIEPVAIALNFWDWNSEVVPLQNYLAWFVIAFVLCISFQFLVKNNRNIVAIGLFILQFIFFFVLGLG